MAWGWLDVGGTAWLAVHKCTVDVHRATHWLLLAGKMAEELGRTKRALEEARSDNVALYEKVGWPLPIVFPGLSSAVCPGPARCNLSTQSCMSLVLALPSPLRKEDRQLDFTVSAMLPR